MKRNIGKPIILLLSLLIILMCLPVGMTQAEDYSYTVRIFGGDQLSKDKNPIIWEKKFSLGEPCVLPDKESLEKLVWGNSKSSKYYIKGCKISGKGGESYLALQRFDVDRDYDLIVAYGMPDKIVTYTIKYVDAETGAQLADPITYYGNVGDKPVVACEYIEGYRPLYNNFEGTLQAEGNVWSFPYLRLVREEPTTQAPAAVQQPAAATPGQTTEQPTNAAGEVIQSEEVAGGTQTNANAGTNTQTAQPQAAGTEGQNAAGGNAPAPAENEGGNTAAGNQNANVPAPAGNESGNTPAVNPGANNGGNAGNAGNAGGNNTGNTGGIDLGGNAGVLTDPELYEFADTEDILDLDVPLAAPTVKNDAAEGKDGKDGKDDKEVTDGTDGAEDVTASTTSEADPNTTTSAKGLSTPLIIIIVAACAVIIIIILLLIFRKKK